MKSVSFPDWFTFNCNEPIITSKVVSEGRGFGNYHKLMTLENGERIQFGHHNTEKYNHVWSGEVVAHHLKERTASDLISKILSHEATFSRLDIAVDVLRDEGIQDKEFISLEQLWGNISMCKSALRDNGGCKIIESEYAKETLYIGDPKKRASKGIFRAYDKGIEQGIGENFLMRFELEVKRDKAQTCALRIARGADIRSIITKYLDFPGFEKWENLMKAPDLIDVYRGEEKAKDPTNYAWLINQVAPAYGRALANNYHKYSSLSIHHEFMKIAYREFQKEFSRLEKKHPVIE